MTIEEVVAVIGLIITFATQGGFTIWWASNISARVGAMEDDMKVAADQRTRLVAVETRIANLDKTLDRIEAKLDTIGGLQTQARLPI